MAKAILLSWLFLGVVFFGQLSSLQAEEVELTNASGTVEVYLKDSDGFAPAEEGMKLEAGDQIRTGSSSFAELSFNQDNTNLVRLGENTATEVTLAEDEKMKMTEGEVFSSISDLPSGSSFEIRTPAAVSGARGTDWVTKVTQEGTDVEAINGEPFVQHIETDGSISTKFTPISQGQMTTVRKFQQPTELRPIPEVRRQQWQVVKQDVQRRGKEAIQKRQERSPFNREDFLKQDKMQKTLGSLENNKDGNYPDRQKDFQGKREGGDVGSGEGRDINMGTRQDRKPGQRQSEKGPARNRSTGKPIAQDDRQPDYGQVQGSGPGPGKDNRNMGPRQDRDMGPGPGKDNRNMGPRQDGKPGQRQSEKGPVRNRGIMGRPSAQGNRQAGPNRSQGSGPGPGEGQSGGGDRRSR